MVTANAQEIVSETDNVQRENLEYIKYINGDTIYYKDNTKISDVFNIFGT